MTTVKEVCQLIAWYFIDAYPETLDKKALTAKDVFNYSPTGELFMVFQWHDEALWYFGRTYAGLGDPETKVNFKTGEYTIMEKPIS